MGSPIGFVSTTNRWCCDGRNGGMIDLVKLVGLAAESTRLFEPKLLKRWHGSEPNHNLEIDYLALQL